MFKFTSRIVLPCIRIQMTHGSNTSEVCHGSRNAGSFVSVRSGVRQWHVFAVSLLNYKVDLSAPPRSSEHVLCWHLYSHIMALLWSACSSKSFCEIEAFPQSCTTRAFKHGEEEPRSSRARPVQVHRQENSFSLGSGSRSLLHRPSEGSPVRVGDQRDTCSRSDDKHLGIWLIAKTEPI